ncbi:hypothetical protein GA0070558_1093 [Micromonospora haikouensis]|uniref:RNase H type-1 domain-containing protein n=1 Tax=Micromonospora haikouensis TaxID=686309 RepID=A0A1C4VH67_9ACTN|nr:hypothetical protein [Micromonospora haikouensis]SCE83308.1 hypothetical protein GA0070558_1093 [Micromonospora haikouensis]
MQAEASNAQEHICENCGVICVPQGDGWIHPEPWATLKSRRVCDNPKELRPANPREIKNGAMQSLKRDRWMIEEQLAALVVPEGSLIRVGVVGCYAPTPEATIHPRGWGYLASDGHYGLGATTTTRRYDGPGELAAELRALFWALRRLLPRYRLEVLTDYPEIRELMNAWRRGNVEAIPPGYDSERRDSGREAKLSRAARTVHLNADRVVVEVVENYADTPLGLGADNLAQIGWKWCSGKLHKGDAKDRGLAAAAQHLNVAPALLSGD